MDGLTSLSVSIWVRITNYASALTPILSVANSSNDNELVLGLDALIIKQSSIWFYTVSEKITLTNTWFHFAFTRNASNETCKIFLNGALRGTKTSISNTALVSEGVFVGNEQDSVGGDF